MKKTISFILVHCCMGLMLLSCQKEEPAVIEPFGEIGLHNTPVINEFFPKAAASHDTITILGENFGEAMSIVRVMIDTQTVEIVSLQDSIIRAIVPRTFRNGLITVFVGKVGTVSEENLRMVPSPELYTQGRFICSGIPILIRESNYERSIKLELVNEELYEKEFVSTGHVFGRCGENPASDEFVVELRCYENENTWPPGDVYGSHGGRTRIMRVTVDTAQRVFRSVHVQDEWSKRLNSSMTPDYKDRVWRLVAADIPYEVKEDNTFSGAVYGPAVDSAVQDVVEESSDVHMGGPYVRWAFYRRTVERKPVAPDAVLRFELIP